MTTYLIILPGDEAAWEAATPEQRAAACGILATAGEPVEIRPCLDGPGQ